jgi:hypothetical protein
MCFPLMLGLPMALHKARRGKRSLVQGELKQIQVGIQPDSHAQSHRSALGFTSKYAASLLTCSAVSFRLPLRTWLRLLW